MRTRLPLLALAVLSLFAAAACSSDDDPSTVEAGEEQEEQVAEFNDADVAFAQQMIPHHQQAVEMAQLAADRAERQEVKDLAARVEAAQAPEIATLEGWLGEWGEDLPMEGMDMDHGQDGMGMMSDKDMSMLESASGAEFDRLFLEMMVRHHSGAIDMAEEELRDGQHPGALEMAQEIKDTQEAEVAEMEALLAELGS
ncbi:MAG TPA: DUF305 domain-containing protein [Acidimicrobiales bacterium]